LAKSIGQSAEPESSQQVKRIEEGRLAMLLNAQSLRFGIASLLLLVTAVGLRSRKEIIPIHDPPSSIPSQIDGWKGTDRALDQETLDILGPGEFLVRDYNSAGEPWVNLYIPYFPTQKAGDTIHSPDPVCRVKDGCQFRAKRFRSRVPTDLHSPSTDMWCQNRATSVWCCIGFKPMAVQLRVSIGPSTISCTIRFA
jgi:hypothetical protein